MRWILALGSNPSLNQDVIALLDLGNPFLFGITSDTFDAFIDWVTSLRPETGVSWVTHSAQVRCEDPRYAMVLGRARAIRSELSIDFATLEI